MRMLSAAARRRNSRSPELPPAGAARGACMNFISSSFYYATRYMALPGQLAEACAGASTGAAAMMLSWRVQAASSTYSFFSKAHAITSTEKTSMRETE